jgi:hypothetical protein
MRKKTEDEIAEKLSRGMLRTVAKKERKMTR